MVSHVERSVVEGTEQEVGRDPRTMEVEEFNALGHEGKPLLQIIRANCKECCGGLEAEVRRCRMIACQFWPYRMGTNPFRTRDLTDEQREAAANRLRAARLLRTGITTEGPSNSVTINGAAVYVTPKQKEAVEIVLKSPRKWADLHGKTRNHMVSVGWVLLNEKGKPSLTDIGQTVATALGIGA